MSSVCLAAGDTFVPVKIDENDLYAGVLKLLKTIRPNWIQENIKLKTLTDGITNKLVSCQFMESSGEKDILLVRIYGNKTDLFIDRSAEIRNIKTLNVLGLAPQVYGIFENGLAYQYYPGVTLNVESVTNDNIWPLVATQMAKMHKVQLGKEIPKEPFVWDKIEQFLNLLPDPFSSEEKQARFTNSFGSITKLRIEYERLKTLLSKTESPIVFAHNDLLLGNVIYNKDEGTISFIDYEYAAYCYQAFDIANHFNEFVGLSIDDIDYDRYPCEEFQFDWIKVYLAMYLDIDHPTEPQIRKVYKEVQQMSLLSHFLWGIWSLVQYEHSDIDFDFVRYAEIRLNRYYELRDKIFKQLS
ncbi:ethanolamine kinase [Spodoptera frugiperda]|uniref:ethanolamine kinase n=2 Tax=Spodoptera frugiperda TaxID=7108 RepID=A0A9R0EG98_SPOFR|nr:ethanolamine kinase [Spodoptera frugiperda]